MRAVNSFRNEESGRSRAVNIPYGIRELADDESLEPQVVKVRSQNRDTLVVTAQFPVGSESEVLSGFMINRAKRIALKKITADICIPVFNRAFNTLGVIANASTFRVVIVCDQSSIGNAFPNSIQKFCEIIRDNINAQTGMTIAFTITAGNIVSWTSNTPWALFEDGLTNIDLDVLGFPRFTRDEAEDAVKITPWITKVTGISTKYLDIGSKALSMDSKISKSGNTVPSFIHRINIDRLEPHSVSYYLDEPNNWINIDQRHIDAIDIQLYPSLRVFKGYVMSGVAGLSLNHPSYLLIPHSVKLTLEFLIES